MGPLAIASMVFVCILGSALVGSCVRDRLPEHHLGDDSMRAASLGVDMVATLGH